MGNNNLSDDQLNAILRDVAIPSDLGSELKQIPLEAKTMSLKTKPASPNYGATSLSSTLKLVLAASLIGIGLLIAFQFLPNPDNKMAKKVGVSDHDKTTPKLVDGGHDAILVDDSLAVFLKEQERLEAEIHKLKIASMKARLNELGPPGVAQLDQREVESLIAAMSEEYAIPLGQPTTKVASRMTQVIQRFPGTRGAKIASEYISQINN